MISREAVDDGEATLDNSADLITAYYSTFLLEDLIFVATVCEVVYLWLS